MWRIVQRNRLRELWEEAGQRLHLRLVQHGRGAVYELVGNVHSTPVSIRLLPESIRHPVTIFVGRRAMARQTGEKLVVDEDPMKVHEGSFEAQLDMHGLVADIERLPQNASVVVHWVHSAVDLYLSHHHEPLQSRA